MSKKKKPESFNKEKNVLNQNKKSGNANSIKDRFLETCDWCGCPNVTYRDEAFTLCEICSEQLFGD
jgi:hypothetical protein